MDTKTLFQGAFQLAVRRFCGPFYFRRRWLDRTQWLTKKALEELQLALFKKTIERAERDVPYYRSMLNGRGMRACDIRTLDDVRGLPILKKKDVVEAATTLLSRAHKRMVLHRAFTGGTTGSPMTVYRNLFSIGTEHAFVRRQWDWAGLKSSDVCAYVKGRMIGNATGHLFDPFMKELHLSTNRLDIETAGKYLCLLRTYDCRGLVGYPSSIFLLAKAQRDMNVDLPVKSVLLTSETLSDEVKRYISEAFKVSVYDFYGAAERVCYIFTCEKGSYHIQPEYGYTELIPSLNGRFRIVATGFWNSAMPLIRYDTGDEVELQETECSCGRQFPTVKTISGREGDYVRTAKGKMLGVSILTHMFHVVCGIDCFIESQMVQESVDRLTIKYVSDESIDSGVLSRYAVQLKKLIADEIDIGFERVDHIEKTSSGKHKFVVSRVVSEKTP